MRKVKSKSAQKVKPLYIYLAGGILALISGIAVRPFSENVHSVIVLLCIGICLFGVYRYFKS